MYRDTRVPHVSRQHKRIHPSFGEREVAADTYRRHQDNWDRQGEKQQPASAEHLTRLGKALRERAVSDSYHSLGCGTVTLQSVTSGLIPK